MKILIVDDERLVAKTLSRLLRAHDVTMIHSSRDAVEPICSGQYDLVFCDLMMPELSGRELFEEVVEREPETAECFVFITGGACNAETDEFLARAPRVLFKPFDRERLRNILASAGAA